MPETRGLPLYFPLLPRTPPTPPPPSFTVFPPPLLLTPAPNFYCPYRHITHIISITFSPPSHFSIVLPPPPLQFYHHHYQRYQISIVLITYSYCFSSITTPPSHYYCSFSSPPPQFHYFPSTTHLPTSKPFQ